MDRIEIQPTSVAQVARTSVGRNIQISDDVQGIARELREIDPALRLEFDPDEELWVVYQVIAEPDGSETHQLVTVWSVELNGELDKRLVNRCRQVCSEGYDLAGELERVDREARRREEHEFYERMGPISDRLGSALLKDLGEDQSRIYVPGRGR